ncbi:vacuolar membrane-associated protein iml1 [Scheffersomyces spartinae]|uniref:Vacuolar membrane-associated protein IML1 n=1 Tax=Scheffersomyces spartinae TaxID=45513 RepID=A0A9P7V7K4_9ASCO|nr:vacuolar membrane-associated protein iml1 [Scheffersomyces spartinae]KAG7192647.1 vacuolar membrane-associated protein iml1 [Scheffersomyces spartinae]
MRSVRMYESGGTGPVSRTVAKNELRAAQTTTMSTSHHRPLLPRNIGTTLIQSPPPRHQPSENEDVPPLEYAECEPINLTVWFHELRTSEEDVLVDLSFLPGARIGDLYELEYVPKHSGSSIRKLVFKITPNSVVSNSRFQISLLSTPLQKALDISARSTVRVTKIAEQESIVLDSIEIIIKDINLSRDAMWNFSSKLIGTCCYLEKRLTFLTNRSGLAKYLFKNGKRVFSGYILEDTKIVFRSESAKVFMMIQLSEEMWNFEETGEIIFHKLVNSLFPRIFKLWRDKNTHHSISIILFTSIDLTHIPLLSFGMGERPKDRRDFFRVVVDQVSTFHWDKIMHNLRLEFANFKRDVMMARKANKYEIEGSLLPASKGNILEAVNLALSTVVDRFRTTDLKHSLNHFVVISPGTGIFDVDYDLFKDTSKRLQNCDSTLDFVCLSQPPLHTVPLFRYKQNGSVKYAVPNWCDISYYKRLKKTSQWIPRCKIYELQMMGIMEIDKNQIQIDRFRLPANAKSVEDVMEKYDKDIFRSSFDSKRLKRRESKLSQNGGGRRFIDPDLLLPNNRTSSLSQIPSTSLLFIGKANTKLGVTDVKPAVAVLETVSNNASVLGTVTKKSVLEASALSSLYLLNKNIEDKTLVSKKDNFLAEILAPVMSTISEQSRGEGTATAATTAAVTLTPRQSMKDARPKSLSSKPKRDERVRVRKARMAKRKLQRKLDQADPTAKLWDVLDNPSRSIETGLVSTIASSKWGDALPPNTKRKLVKWRSFQSPAALPVTTSLFPALEQLDNDYMVQNYSVMLNSENYLELTSSVDLFREMIQLRILLGFQICYGKAVETLESEKYASGNKVDNLMKYFPENREKVYGGKIYMLLDDEIHRLYCDYEGLISIQLYRRVPKKEAKEITLGKKQFRGNYPHLIRTRYVDEYLPQNLDFSHLQFKKYNWNQFDQYLAGYEDSMSDENKSFHHMKFVVMPAEIPKNAYFINNEKLTDEEIRVEGLRKLIGAIEKGKYSRSSSSKRKKKEEIYPEIEFYTGNLYEYLLEQTKVSQLSGLRTALMMNEKVRFSKSIKLSILAQELQDTEGGLTLVDRTWHFKTHLHCFLGSEFVSWLIENFEDIDNRDEAAQYGQSLMKKGLFKHVDNRHGLLDGYYFYEFEEEYFDKKRYEQLKALSRSALWFQSLRKQDGGGSKPDSKAGSLIETTSDLDTDGDSKKPAIAKFTISRKIKYDMDPLKKSFRPEVVTIHYDRVHNTEHCYHVRLEWLNTNKKFIDDAINGWSRLCERHGLKLVETPWKELCTISQYNPFHSFVEIYLSLDPWKDAEFLDSKFLVENRFFYHLYLLKQCNFLLDNRAAVFFQRDDIKIEYSWGQPTFKYAQFIHKSGSYIVELRHDGSFFLAPNNLHLVRLRSGSSGINDIDKSMFVDSQRIMLLFRASCRNDDYLRNLFRQAKVLWQKEYDDIIPN